MCLTHSQLMGECSFDKRSFEFPLTVALVRISSRRLWHKGTCSLKCSVQSIVINIYIYIPSSSWL